MVFLDFQGDSMGQQIAVESRDRGMVIGPHLLTEASHRFRSNAWIFSENTQLGRLEKTKRRSHYIEVYRSREGFEFNESTWLYGLEKIHDKEFRFVIKSTETLDLNQKIREWIATLPYEDRLEAMAVEVLCQQSRASWLFHGRTAYNRYHGSASLYRHQS